MTVLTMAVLCSVFINSFIMVLTIQAPLSKVLRQEYCDDCHAFLHEIFNPGTNPESPPECRWVAYSSWLELD